MSTLKISSVSMTFRRTTILAATMLLAGWGVSCSPERIVDNATLPPDVADPGLTKTPAGAVAAYHGTLSLFNSVFAGYYLGGTIQASFVPASGVMSDELRDGAFGAAIGVFTPIMPLDSRVAPECGFAVPTASCNEQYYDALYSGLQRVRANANEARGLLTHYAPASLRALTGHLYALSAYAETFLADMFCSGIPLSTLDYDGNYTLKPGSTTDEVYQHAILFFDSALTLAADSDRVMNLARIGKGRVLLDLGQYAMAAQTVANVPDGFTYREMYTALSPSGASTPSQRNFAYYQSGAWGITAVDTEGGTGLNFRSSGDSRTAATALTVASQFGDTLYHPNKYASDGTTPVVVADWIEARLIEAEASLQAGDFPGWLSTLNHLRETATTPALADVTDPGTPDARVDLMFRERAFWLYLTGHRQADLRRLIRQYGRPASSVYPTGKYRGGTGSYGVDVNAPIPAREREGNTSFTGCLNRGA